MCVSLPSPSTSTSLCLCVHCVCACVCWFCRALWRRKAKNQKPVLNEFWAFLIFNALALRCLHRCLLLLLSLRVVAVTVAVVSVVDVAVVICLPAFSAHLHCTFACRALTAPATPPPSPYSPSSPCHFYSSPNILLQLFRIFVKFNEAQLAQKRKPREKILMKIKSKPH